MDVIGVAVVGGAQGDDGIQPRRLACRHLQAIEAAPGYAHHAHLACAPGLAHQPGNHLLGVGEFLLGVFVLHDAVGIAIAAHVDAHTGVTVASQIGVRQGITHDSAVALAVGQVFQNGGNRMLVGIHRQPHAGGKAGAVGQGNESVGNLFDLAREGLDGFHSKCPVVCACVKANT